MNETSSARGYRSVADALRERIESGSYQPGSQLPTEVQLTKEFDVARDTVRRAIALLAEEGIVVKSHGRGSFVRDDSRREIGLSKHAQIAAELSDIIRAGEVPIDASFLTEAKIQERYSVSRRTARAALKVLEDSGLVQIVGRRRMVTTQAPASGRPNSR